MLSILTNIILVFCVEGLLLGAGRAFLLLFFIAVVRKVIASVWVHYWFWSCLIAKKGIT